LAYTPYGSPLPCLEMALGLLSNDLYRTRPQ
jgi:hypothetical protein